MERSTKHLVLGCTLVLATIASQSDFAHAGDSSSRIWALLRPGTVVLDGSVEDVRVSRSGAWHAVRVHETVWPPHDSESTIDVFVHGAGFSESVELSPGDRYLFGARRMSADGGGFERALLAERPGAESRPAALGAPDAFVRLGEGGVALAERGRLLKELRTLAPHLQTSEPVRAPDFVELTPLLDSTWSFVREGALRVYLSRPVRAHAVWLGDLRQGFSSELEGPGSENVLLAYLDVFRSIEVPGCDRDLCELVLHEPHGAVLEEAMATLARVATDETLRTLSRRYDNVQPGAQGRILEVLARCGWDDATRLCERSLESDSESLRVASVRALGHVRSERATDILEALASSAPTLRDEAVTALARQRSERSRHVLRNLRRDGRIGPASLRDRPLDLSRLRRSIQVHEEK